MESNKKEKIVLMGEVCVVNPEDGCNTLSTYGLETCFGLVLKDEINKVFALCHFDSDTCVKDGIEKVIAAF